MSSKITRRDFIKKSALVGASATSLSALLSACGTGASQGSGPAQGSEVTLKVWAEAAPTEHWRADGPAKAAANVTNYKIKVEPTNDSAAWEDYKRKFTLAADSGQAPNIVVSGHEDVAVWSKAGYIVPLDNCRSSHKEFSDVIDSLWKSASYDGKTWGIPQDTEARPMFFHKKKLAELGWSQQDVDSLPQRIKDGQFTLDDMINTGRQAIDKKVIEPGYGYWHRSKKGADFLQYYVAYGGRLYDEGQKKLVVSRDPLVKWYGFQRKVVDEGLTPKNYIGTDFKVWHDTVSHGKALFWNGGTWNWADWAKNYVKDLGGQDYLFSFAGYALQPNGQKGKQGLTLSHPLVYMVTSQQASGASNQDPSCALLAKTTTPEINTLHAVDSAHLGILKSQATYPPYTQDRFLTDTLYMLDYNFYQPNDPMYGPYFDALWNSMVKAENGEKSPEQAADEAISLIKNQAGQDKVIFE